MFFLLVQWVCSLLVQWVTAKMGGFLKSTIGTTPAESMNAAANIFLGPAGKKLNLVSQLCLI
jgi:nucleoside permease NupC